MDGLTIRNSEALINQGQTTRELNRIEQPQRPSPTGSITEPSGPSFADSLKQAVNNVNQLQKEADVKMQELATGKSQNIHETMIAAEKADISLRLMMQVRNKVIEAYQEVMKMQV
jgi:flagellar hook-basal body complex protein FliE